MVHGPQRLSRIPLTNTITSHAPGMLEGFLSLFDGDDLNRHRRSHYPVTPSSKKRERVRKLNGQRGGLPSCIYPGRLFSLHTKRLKDRVEVVCLTPGPQ